MRIPVAKAQNKPREYSLSIQKGSVTESNRWAWESVQASYGAGVESLQLQLRVEREGKGLRISGTVDVSGHQECSACGEPTSTEVHAKPSLVYQAQETEVLISDEVELEKSDLEVGWYSENELDLGDVLQEIVALELPIRIICKKRESCESRSAALFKQSDPIKRANPFASLKKMCL